MDPRNYDTQQVKILNSDNEDNQKDLQSNKPIPSVTDPVDPQQNQAYISHQNLVEVQIKSTHSAEQKGEHHSKVHTNEFHNNHNKHSKPAENLNNKLSQEHEVKSDGQQQQQFDIVDGQQAIRRPSSVEKQIKEMFLPHNKKQDAPQQQKHVNQKEQQPQKEETIVKKIAVPLVASFVAAGISKYLTNDKGLSAILGYGAFAISLIFQRK